MRDFFVLNTTANQIEQFFAIFSVLCMRNIFYFLRFSKTINNSIINIKSK